MREGDELAKNPLSACCPSLHFFFFSFMPFPLPFYSPLAHGGGTLYPWRMVMYRRVAFSLTPALSISAFSVILLVAHLGWSS